MRGRSARSNAPPHPGRAPAAASRGGADARVPAVARRTSARTRLASPLSATPPEGFEQRGRAQAEDGFPFHQTRRVAVAAIVPLPVPQSLLAPLGADVLRRQTRRVQNARMAVAIGLDVNVIAARDAAGNSLGADRQDIVVRPFGHAGIGAGGEYQCAALPLPHRQLVVDGALLLGR